MKLVSMKRSVDMMNDVNQPSDITTSEPQWAWGLRITLEKEEIDKLGLEADKLTTEHKMRIEAECKVVAVRISKEDRGRERRTVELQITDMAISGVSVKQSKFNTFKSVQDQVPTGE